MAVLSSQAIIFVLKACASQGCSHFPVLLSQDSGNGKETGKRVWGVLPSKVWNSRILQLLPNLFNLTVLSCYVPEDGGLAAMFPRA